MILKFGVAKANEPVTLSQDAVEATSQEFVVLPANLCAEAKYKGLCATAKLPTSAQGKLLEIRNTPQATAAYALSNGIPDDHYELLCYRCALGKFATDRQCGRYKPIYKKESWAKKCPAEP